MAVRFGIFGLFLFLFAASLPASAQSYGPPPGYGYGPPPGYNSPPNYGPPPDYGPPPGYNSRPNYGPPSGYDLGQEIERLHADLNLRPDQQAAWIGYARLLNVSPQVQQRRQQAAQRMANLSAPERMDLSIQMMKSDLASLESRGAALKAFYAVLTPEQQATFDRETMGPPQ